VAFGYNAAFLTLAAVAVIALLVIVVAMPETTPTPGKLDQPPLGWTRNGTVTRTLVPLISISQHLCFPSETDPRRRSLLLRPRGRSRRADVGLGDADAAEA
jgi:hypothetical protein